MDTSETNSPPGPGARVVGETECVHTYPAHHHAMDTDFITKIRNEINEYRDRIRETAAEINECHISIQSYHREILMREQYLKLLHINLDGHTLVYPGDTYPPVAAPLGNKGEGNPYQPPPYVAMGDRAFDLTTNPPEEHTQRNDI